MLYVNFDINQSINQSMDIVVKNILHGFSILSILAM